MLEEILEINKVGDYKYLDLFLPCIESYEVLFCECKVINYPL